MLFKTTVLSLLFSSLCFIKSVGSFDLHPPNPLHHISLLQQIFGRDQLPLGSIWGNFDDDYTEEIWSWSSKDDSAQSSESTRSHTDVSNSKDESSEDLKVKDSKDDESKDSKAENKGSSNEDIDNSAKEIPDEDSIEAGFFSTLQAFSIKFQKLKKYKTFGKIWLKDPSTLLL